MKKSNLKELRLNKKSIAAFMSQIQGGIKDSSVHNRTKSALPLCPGCQTIPGLQPECDLEQQ
ncbi:hypothetical protein KORDIASMS9_03586 [Kordia sp. SMS9]|uniref:hypothetical protein n=1 Tax=Kordia sp. SMS9 TaxID=2282170 RepID=UPI000E0DABF6|nr:hypothetical protein [Kordia sp. SMS9]AXG71329.1 hypothetical protein KORDIASMS9_03586 [Kordia sp. SMS9]